MKLFRCFLDKYKNMPVQSKAALWFAICSMIQQGISFITTPIFSRLLTDAEYGIYGVFDSWKRIIIIFASLNLASGVYLRGIIKYEDDEEEFTASLQSLFLLLFLCVLTIYMLFSGFWNEVFEMPSIYMYCMFVDMLANVAFHFWSARQRVNFQYKALIVVTLANAIVKPALGIIAITLYPDHITARIFTIALADFLTFGYFFFTMFIKKGKKISTKYWKYALNYNIPLVPHYLSSIVLNQADRIMIKSICGESSAGQYTLAYTASSAMTVINQAILNTYNPWMYQQLKKKNYKAIGPYSMKLLLIVAVANMLVIIMAPEIIFILGSEKYKDAIGVIPPVVMSVYFMFLYSLFANFEFYFEKTKIMMIASVMGATLNVALNAIFIPKFGYLAAGYTTLFCYICFSLFHYVVMRIIMKKEIPGIKVYNMFQILILSVAFVVIGFSCIWLYNHLIIKYTLIFALIIIFIWKKDVIIKQIKNK